ncbi:MAG: Hpt domain-containing protein [Treponema sp.]|nr:Hpt domain-containing protein [Candidatus Treponema caballi]
MTIQDFYSAIDGEYTEILARLANEDRIRRFLKKMLETGDMEALKEAWEKKSSAEIFSYSHRLKGIAQNLSLSRFEALTSSLTEAFRNGPAQDMDAAAENYTALCNEYETIAALISQL